MRKWPANLASNSSLLLGTILFVEGTNVQQGQWTLILSPRFLSKREKEIIFPREVNISQPPLLHQAVSIRWNFWMNPLTSERHPLLHSLCDVDRKPRPFGTRLYCSGVDVPLRRCRHIVRFENLLVWRETNHKLIWLTHSFICCSISCTVWHENTSCKCDESNPCSCCHYTTDSLLVFGTTQAFCLEKPQALLLPGIFPRAALWCAPVGLELWRCEILLWPKYWNFAPRWWRRSPLSWSTGSEEAGWLSLWNKGGIHFGFIYTLWSVRGFQRVNLKEIKLALVPKRQM